MHETLFSDVLEHVDVSDLRGWVDGAEDPKAQRRRPGQHRIHVDYSIRWQGDRLTISLRNNRPAERNYVVYVVVEETLGSGRVLHTVEGIPVTGQITYVPTTFFDEELAALAKVAKLLRDFAERYSRSLGPIPRPEGPGDPDPGWLFGVDRHVLAADPVMRAFEFNAASTPQDASRLLGVVLRHPPASAVLAALLDEQNLSLDALHLPGAAVDRHT